MGKKKKPPYKVNKVKQLDLFNAEPMTLAYLIEQGETDVQWDLAAFERAVARHVQPMNMIVASTPHRNTEWLTAAEIRRRFPSRAAQRATNYLVQCQAVV